MKAKTNNPDDLFLAIKKDFTPDADDCFSKEYSHQAEECNMCSMRNICMVLTCKSLEEVAAKKFEALTPFADEIDWDAIPYAQILGIIAQNPTPLEQVRQVFGHYSKCKDPITVNLRVNKFIRDNSLTLNADGCIIK
jgi:hypothetical protein